jgi:hypothetical protein
MNKPDLFSQSYQKEPSEKYKYKHIHTGEYCTFEAYVAEFIILRRAEKLNIGMPSYKFWTKGDPNHWTWLKQLNAARALSKKYSEEAVLSAIKSSDFNKFLLIGVQKGRGRGWEVNPAVDPIIKKHFDLIEIQKSKETKEFEKVVEQPVRRTATTGKGSLINRLRNIDGKSKKE